MTMKTTVTMCIYKRTKRAKTERGIMIGEGDLIIDKNNKSVKVPIWTYTILWQEGTLPVEL